MHKSREAIDQQQAATYIEPQFKRLLCIEGFTEAFWEQQSNFKRGEDAFDFVNQQYKDVFGEIKYKSYESFIVCRNRYLKSFNGKENKD
jgi:hypothetical protein